MAQIRGLIYISRPNRRFFWLSSLTPHYSFLDAHVCFFNNPLVLSLYCSKNHLAYRLIITSSSTSNPNIHPFHVILAYWLFTLIFFSTSPGPMRANCSTLHRLCYPPGCVTTDHNSTLAFHNVYPNMSSPRGGSASPLGSGLYIHTTPNTGLMALYNTLVLLTLLM